MYEVELKVRAAHEPVRSRLEATDAERIGRVRQVDTYYDAPHRDFAATDEALRLREETADEDSRTRVTYKGPLVEAESKTREEFETAVADAETMGAILESVGFSPAATVEKRRERYSLEGYTVTLDEVEGLGSFVEVEREAPASELETVREDAAALLERLGLEPAEQIRTSYLGLLLGDDTGK
jgi:adenylate cyclase class 2